jgi:hypothetical protein
MSQLFIVVDLYWLEGWKFGVMYSGTRGTDCFETTPLQELQHLTGVTCLCGEPSFDSVAC